MTFMKTLFHVTFWIAFKVHKWVLLQPPEIKKKKKKRPDSNFKSWEPCYFRWKTDLSLSSVGKRSQIALCTVSDADRYFRWKTCQGLDYILTAYLWQDWNFKTCSTSRSSPWVIQAAGSLSGDRHGHLEETLWNPSLWGTWGSWHLSTAGSMAKLMNSKSTCGLFSQIGIWDKVAIALSCLVFGFGFSHLQHLADTLIHVTCITAL